MLKSCEMIYKKWINATLKKQTQLIESIIDRSANIEYDGWIDKVVCYEGWHSIRVLVCNATRYSVNACVYLY